jgi:phage terminase large subunit-like protein
VPKDPKKLSPETHAEIARWLHAVRAASEPRPWELAARNKQLPPDHPRHHLPWTHPKTGVTYSCGCDGPTRDWTTWICLAGRGTGKTRAGAEWAIAMALSEPEIYVGVCAPTYIHVRKTCFEDLQSGIVANAQPGEIREVNKNNLSITMRNGSIIQGFSAENVDSVRGANLSYCWFDELAMIKYVRFFDYGLKPALRIKPKNNDPRLMITTTPSKLRLIRDLVEMANADPRRFHITTASSSENPYFAEGALADLRRQYKGTYLEQQELEGKLVQGSDGALFSAENFCEYRIYPEDVPEWRRIVVAIDPASTSSESSDETGIVVAAESGDHHFYILEDLSLRGTPKRCMEVVASAFHRWEADLVVGENTVGDYMPELLSKEDPNIPYKSVAAMKGKYIRAESISHLAAAGRLHMVGEFEMMEKQLTAMIPEIERSRQHDDRADAAIWALIELSRRSGASYMEMYSFYPCTECGENVNQLLDKMCRHCGAGIAPQEKERVRDRANRWHMAYSRTCENNHVRPMNMPSCPECNTDPSFYLKQLAAFTGSSTGAHVYAGKDWRRR